MYPSETTTTTPIPTVTANEQGSSSTPELKVSDINFVSVDQKDQPTSSTPSVILDRVSNNTSRVSPTVASTTKLFQLMIEDNVTEQPKLAWTLSNQTADPTPTTQPSITTGTVVTGSSVQPNVTLTTQKAVNGTSEAEKPFSSFLKKADDFIERNIFNFRRFIK